MRLTKQQVETILKNAPTGVDKTKLLDGLVQRGYELEGVDSSKVKARLALTPDGSKQGFFADATQDIKSTIQNIDAAGDDASREVGEAVSATRKGEQGIGRGVFQALGAVLKGASRVAGNIFTGGAKIALPQSAEDATKEGLTAVATPVMQSEPIQNLVRNYEALASDPSPEAQKVKRDLDALMGIGEFAMDLTGVGVTKKAGSAAAELAQTATKAGREAVEGTIEATAKTARTLVEKAKPAMPSPFEAVGQVLQGKTKDVKAGVRGLSQLDTSGVRTFEELSQKINEKIPELARQVDDDLVKDPKLYSLEDLRVSGKTAAGELVKVDYVGRALQHLEELYESVGDAVSQKNIQDLISKAKSTGLTRKEVNDLARTYGTEFKSKAFSKLGDALTSVNAQKFENTRKALKAKAREGIGGTAAKTADESMSALYKTRDLVAKNVEAVNKLRQKIQDRGLLEKLGHAATKGLDLISGGTVRGLVGGLLPRGVGYKVMNALDLEKALSRNLEIIQKAIKESSDAEIVKLLEGFAD